ncbi:MAG: DJ-1/PfpI family protein [Desulfovibrio sp.]|nr:DJ-1/PfpI family protein [Desulfovibrio sp.]
MKNALLIYANGSEDLEITACADILSRGGVQVIRAALNDDGSSKVTLAHGTVVLCDGHLDEMKDTYDIIVIPGGLAGSEHCRDSARLVKCLQKQKDEGRFIAAICAAPGFVLQNHGMLNGVRATCYPGCNDAAIADLQPDGVVVDEKAKIVTGKGPGFAIPFALTILEILQGESVRKQVAKGMLLDE